MHIEQVEIFSDRSNAAVMRHPGRSFPGCLIQGDSLNNLVHSIREVKSESDKLSENAAYELFEVCEKLEDLLAHYKETLLQHRIDLPF